MTKSRRYKALVGGFDRNNLYSLEEAVDLIKKSSVKFKETVDIAINLGVDPRHADQLVRGTVSLPNGTGKRVLRFWLLLRVIMCLWLNLLGLIMLDRMNLLIK